MSAILDWPANLKPRDISFIPPSKTRSLTTSLTDFEQVQPVIRPPWRAQLVFNNLTPTVLLAYRALLGWFEGRTNLVRVPVFDQQNSASGEELGIGVVPHSDGAYFSDGSGYAVIDIADVFATGVQGARTLDIDFGAYGEALQAGQYFGLADDLHLATFVSWSGTVATVRFTPSLRRDFAAEPVKLRPTIIMRKADDDGGEHNLSYGRWAAPSLDLIEAFYEPY